MVLPFLTQVIVFFALFVVGDGEAVGEIEGLGSAVGVVGVADAMGADGGNGSMSYATFPSAFFTLIGKFSGSGVSDRCFITERTSGLKFGNTCDAPSAVIPARRVRISVNRLL
jgi:hypothetical protein